MTDFMMRGLEDEPTPDYAPGVSDKTLLKFSGSVPADDLAVMKKAIHEGCE